QEYGVMNTQDSRREFIKKAGSGAAAIALSGCTSNDMFSETGIAQTAIPRWRGFNLLNYFQALDSGSRSSCMISEDECRWIRDWGFDFIRIPMDYWLWLDVDYKESRKITPEDVYKIKESTLATVDRTVDIGKKYGLHVSLNFHRVPGYCINNAEREPFVLWSDKRAEDAFIYHWDVFAKRYKTVSADDLSFNLVNEAPTPREGYMSRADYVRIMTRATNKIRESTPDRVIIVDGLNVGNVVIDELIPLGVVQSVHAYTPAQISHYRASWVDRGRFPEPSWPSIDGDSVWDRKRLEEHYAPWAELARKGVGVHCGECGCWNRTPHDVFLAWFGDVMDILKGHGIGYSLWEFNGGFGVIDSGRDDIDYEDWQGHKLDRKLLTMLQKY
ncbi:cellulase family glycosylhydrolase, partial [Candidatus Latescibacterota bacterium]